MVKKMNKNWIIGTLIIILLLIGGTSIYKVKKLHEERLLLVSSKRIVEKARLCYIEKKCQGKSVTLKTLYDLKYLTIEANPITKEYYNENSYVKKEEDQYTFIIVD